MANIFSDIVILEMMMRNQMGWPQVEIESY